MTDARPETKVLDGGLGTELAADETLVFKDHPLWTASLLKDNPRAIKEAHSRFLSAGSEAVITASYQASVDGFMKYCNVSAEDAQLLLQSSVDIAKDAVKGFSSMNKSNKDLYVAASVGPYGATLHDMSEYDGHYVKTMTAQDAKTTFHGDNFVESVKKVSLNPQVDSIGVNCCEVTYVEELLRSVKDILQPHQTLIAYPNSWQKFVDKRSVGLNSYGSFVAWIMFGCFVRWVCDVTGSLSGYVEKWLSIGAMGWIGGCCGVTSPQVGDMSQIVKNWNSSVDNLSKQANP